MKNMRGKLALGTVLALLLVVIVVEYRSNQTTPATSLVGAVDSDVNVTLLSNAGVMIEADGMRIYIDPVDLPNSYMDYPADAVLITHHHGDHCHDLLRWPALPDPCLCLDNQPPTC